jgi:hypothetical protein
MIRLAHQILRRSSVFTLGLALVGCYPVNSSDTFPLQPGYSWNLSFERGGTVVYRALLTRGFDKKPSTDGSGATYLELQSGPQGGVGIIEGNSLFIAVHLDVAHGRAMGCRLAYPFSDQRLKLEIRGAGFVKSGGGFAADTGLACKLWE